MRYYLSASFTIFKFFYSPELALEKDGFETNPPSFGCFVAEDVKGTEVEGSKLVGYALYYHAYSSWSGKKMFLEDMYVSERFRGKHIGARLYKEVAKKAVVDSCEFLEHMMLSWNPARTFYEARGCEELSDSDKLLIFRLKGEALKKTATAEL